jgi:hypothetical protein
MTKPFIVWTGRMDSMGTVWPSCSLGTADTVEEAAEKAREWQERVHRNYPTRTRRGNSSASALRARTR